MTTASITAAVRRAVAIRRSMAARCAASIRRSSASSAAYGDRTCPDTVDGLKNCRKIGTGHPHRETCACQPPGKDAPFPVEIAIGVPPENCEHAAWHLEIGLAASAPIRDAEVRSSATPAGHGGWQSPCSLRAQTGFEIACRPARPAQLVES